MADDFNLDTSVNLDVSGSLPTKPPATVENPSLDFSPFQEPEWILPNTPTVSFPVNFSGGSSGSSDHQLVFNGPGINGARRPVSPRRASSGGEFDYQRGDGILPTAVPNDNLTLTVADDLIEEVTLPKTAEELSVDDTPPEPNYGYPEGIKVYGPNDPIPGKFRAALSGAAEGGKGGASIVADTLSFGLSDKFGVTESDKYAGGVYDFSRGSAEVGRESLILAAMLASGGTVAPAAEGAKATETAATAAKAAKSWNTWSGFAQNTWGKVGGAVKFLFGTPKRAGITAGSTAVTGGLAHFFKNFSLAGDEETRRKRAVDELDAVFEPDNDYRPLNSGNFLDRNAGGDVLYSPTGQFNGVSMDSFTPEQRQAIEAARLEVIAARDIYASARASVNWKDPDPLNPMDGAEAFKEFQRVAPKYADALATYESTVKSAVSESQTGRLAVMYGADDSAFSNMSEATRKVLSGDNVPDEFRTAYDAALDETTVRGADGTLMFQKGKNERDLQKTLDRELSGTVTDAAARKFLVGRGMSEANTLDRIAPYSEEKVAAPGGGRTLSPGLQRSVDALNTEINRKDNGMTPAEQAANSARLTAAVDGVLNATSASMKSAATSALAGEMAAIAGSIQKPYSAESSQRNFNSAADGMLTAARDNGASEKNVKLLEGDVNRIKAQLTGVLNEIEKSNATTDAKEAAALVATTNAISELNNIEAGKTPFGYVGPDGLWHHDIGAELDMWTRIAAISTPFLVMWLQIRENDKAWERQKEGYGIEYEYWVKQMRAREYASNRPGRGGGGGGGGSAAPTGKNVTLATAR